ncbi:MAG: glycosyltransferase family 2 protein [Anaerolineae bacterium]|nr:glycosyltransferase family 2 protein [Anaerolineae bacterium]
MKTCALVLAWNHVDDTLECLDSLLALRPAPEWVVVADNGSTDGTPEAVRARFPSVRVLSSGENLGVAGGYNYGVRAGVPPGATHVLITNNDVTFDRGALGALERRAGEPPRPAMLMPKILHYADHSRLWCAGGRWRRFPPGVKMIGLDRPDGPEYSQPFALDYAPSCTLFVSLEALRQVGLFDEGYFFYYDDWDFSARLRQVGLAIGFAPDALVYHKVSVSTQKDARPARWWRTMGRSSVRFYRKHSTLTNLALMTAWFALRETAKGNCGRVRPYLEGVLESWRGHD